MLDTPPPFRQTRRLRARDLPVARVNQEASARDAVQRGGIRGTSLCHGAPSSPTRRTNSSSSGFRERGPQDRPAGLLNDCSSSTTPTHPVRSRFAPGARPKVSELKLLDRRCQCASTSWGTPLRGRDCRCQCRGLRRRRVMYNVSQGRHNSSRGVIYPALQRRDRDQHCDSSCGRARRGYESDAQPVADAGQQSGRAGIQLQWCVPGAAHV